MGDRKNIGNMTSEEIISIYEALQSGINVNQLCKLTGRCDSTITRIRRCFDSVKDGVTPKTDTQEIVNAAYVYFGKRIDGTEKPTQQNENKDMFAVNRALIAIETQLKTLNEKQDATNRLLTELVRIWGAVEVK